MRALILDRLSPRDDVPFKLMAAMDYVFEEVQAAPDMYKVVKDRRGKMNPDCLYTVREITEYIANRELEKQSERGNK